MPDEQVCDDVGVSEVTAAAEDARDVDLYLLGTLAVALLGGGALGVAAWQSATTLLLAIAAVQAILGFGWIYGTEMPGRKGAVAIAALAAAASDITVSVWPHGRLGTLLAVLGLAMPVMFIHQLMRGAARIQVVSSLSAVAVLVFAEISAAALLQLRHEFGAASGGRVATAAIAALGGALVVGCLVDLVYAAPRFDSAVPRGLLGLLAAAGLGGSASYLLLHHQHGFAGGRAAFVGAALGALSGLIAVGAAFVLYTTPDPDRGFRRLFRPMLSGLLPIALLAPVAFLLCLAIRT